MPIHDLGFRKWDGELEPESMRWTVIAQTGIRLAWQNPWLKRLLFLAWMPAAYLGITLFFYEQVATNAEPGPANAIRFMLRRFTQSGIPRASREPTRGQQILGAFGPRGFRGENADTNRDPSLMVGKDDHRHEFWALVLTAFFGYMQGATMVLVVGMIGPPLITRDIRSRGFLLYFCRPISTTEYVIGKAAVVCGYLSLITLLPGLTLYLLGVMLSPDLSVIWYTWDLPLRVIAASLVMMIPTTALALMFSSMTSESRYAAFTWFAVWILGWVSFSTMQQLARGRDWSALSLYHTLGTVQSWVFGLSASPSRALAAATLLFAITISAGVVIFRRVSAPMQV